MALRKFLILRRPRSGRLEGRTTPIQTIVDFLTPTFAGKTRKITSLSAKLCKAIFEILH